MKMFKDKPTTINLFSRGVLLSTKTYLEKLAKTNKVNVGDVINKIVSDHRKARRAK